jgi:radical SAM superfamily enzyme YgiQ (UPF0313 family)
LASPAASLRQAGIDVECVDASRDKLEDTQILAAGTVAFYLPMHTATRLAAPLIERVRAVNQDAAIAAYGLYAPLNEAWLRQRGVSHVFGPEAEDGLVDLVKTQNPTPKSPSGRGPGPEALSPASARSPRVHYLQPDRSTLPPLERYAALQMPDGTRRVVGNTDATRGCKHLCRHCPIVPVYKGSFRAVPLDIVMADVRAQVASGAEHITFGDPDFFNGPTHARKLVEQFATEFPGVGYDVTIKIEHLLRHPELLPVLRQSGCLFVTSAVESVDDAVLAKLRKGHTRADFVRATALCRAAGLTLVPTFVAFTPWTTLHGYIDLLEQVDELHLIEAVAPIQLAIRLLVTADSALLELPEIRAGVDPYDAGSLTWPWRHADRRVDALQQQVMHMVVSMSGRPRTEVFAAIALLAGAQREHRAGPALPGEAGRVEQVPPCATTIPYLTEGWYCCAEPGPEMIGNL